MSWLLTLNSFRDSRNWVFSQLRFGNPVDTYIFEILYKTLISVTIAFLTIIIPFCGAYWLFKKTSKLSAESNLFQTGREIGEELRNATHIRSPLGGIYYSVIDRHLTKVRERDRDLAIYELAKLLHSPLLGPNHENNIEPSEAANLFVAIVSDRLDSLVPQGVNWSGRGSVFSSFGEEITVENKLFPFGTKLYRQWIDRFSILYNTIWLFTHSYRLKEFAENFANSNQFYSEQEIIDWFKKVESTLEKINKLHTRLITQIQIIDNNVNERYFLLNLLACGAYLLLLSLSGYFYPVYLSDIGLLTTFSLFLLSISSLATIILSVLRLFVRTSQLNEKYELRRIYLLPLKTRLREMKKSALRYKPHYFENALSRADELKLPRRTCVSLQKVVNAINSYNEEGKNFKDRTIQELSRITINFKTNEVNQQGFGLSLEEIPDSAYDFSAICSRIISETGNFSINYNEQHSSRSLLTINLSELEDYKTNTLVNELKSLRATLQNLKVSKCLAESQNKLEFEIAILEAEIDRVINKEPFDFAIWLCNAKQVQSIPP